MIKLSEILKSEILKSLPGPEIQWQMASSERMIRSFPGIAEPDAREAAVLILLYPHKGHLNTVFIQRTDYDGVHGGQISFPGGKKESSDLNLVETALRETEEETGADKSEIEIIGTLSPLFIPVSNTVVTPVVGWSDYRPDFRLGNEEVEFLIEAAIKRFIEPSVVKRKPFGIRGELIEIKYFDCDGHIIWGATAMILNELLAIISRSGIHLSPHL